VKCNQRGIKGDNKMTELEIILIFLFSHIGIWALGYFMGKDIRKDEEFLESLDEQE